MPADYSLPYRHLETRLIWIQDRLLEKSEITNAITAEEIPAWYVRRGRLSVLMDGETVQATAGTWVFPQQGHGSVRTVPRSQILSIRFRLRRPDGNEVYHRRQTLVLSRRKYPEISRAADTLLDLVGRRKMWFHDAWKPDSCSRYLAMEAAFFRWLQVYSEIMEVHGCAREPEQSDPLAAQVYRELVTWELSRPFSRAALESLTGMSTPTISRRFGKFFGTTPREFLEQRRLAWAQRRLAESGEQVKAIAAELGFRSVAQFSHWFRMRNENSPRDYRRLFQSSG